MLCSVPIALLASGLGYFRGHGRTMISWKSLLVMGRSPRSSERRSWVCWVLVSWLARLVLVWLGDLRVGSPDPAWILCPIPW